MNDALVKIVPIILKLESTVGTEVECVDPDEWHNDLRQVQRHRMIRSTYRQLILMWG